MSETVDTPVAAPEPTPIQPEATLAEEAPQVPQVEEKEKVDDWLDVSKAEVGPEVAPVVAPEAVPEAAAPVETEVPKEPSSIPQETASKLPETDGLMKGAVDEKDYDEEDIEVGKKQQPHGIFNGHLMKWRYEAEEGNTYVRIPSFIGALLLIVSTTYVLVFIKHAWSFKNFGLSVLIYIIAILALILEGRFLCPNPLGVRAHLRSALTRKNKLFRFVWGRGFLYLIAGVLSYEVDRLVAMATGAYMALIGISAIFAGTYASNKFYALRNALRDEVYLIQVFNRYDSDQDGYISLPEFVNVLSSLGMELDDRFGIKTFHAADTDNDYKISYEDFHLWWKGGYVKGEVTNKIGIDSDSDSEDEGGYQRME